MFLLQDAIATDCFTTFKGTNTVLYLRGRIACKTPQEMDIILL